MSFAAVTPPYQYHRDSIDKSMSIAGEEEGMAGSDGAVVKKLWNLGNPENTVSDVAGALIGPFYSALRSSNTL